MRHYQASDLRADAIAGLTTAVMLIPQAMGYAMLAGLPPIHGLCAAWGPILVYAALGTSRHLAVGPVAMDSILVVAGVGAIASAGTERYILLAAATAVIVGAIQASLGFLRAGFLVNFLSRAVIVGFTAAAAIIIATSQLAHLLGVDLSRTGGVHAIVLQALRAISSWFRPTVALGTSALALLFTLQRKWPRVPAALVVVTMATLAVWLLGLADRGVAIVGAEPAGLPQLSVPVVEMDMVWRLLPVAGTVALVSFMETISVGRAIARQHRYDVVPNRELLAIGFANLTGGMTGGYPVAGGLSRTAVNARAGARTQLAALVTGVMVVIALFAFTQAIYFLPKAALSAVIVGAVVGLIDIRGAIEIYRVKKANFAMVAITFVATLFFGIQYGIMVGIGVSVFLFLVQTTKPHFAVLGRIPGSQTYLNIERHPHAERIPGIRMVRIDAQLYFGNVSFLKETVRKLLDEADDPVRALVLEAAGVNQLDSAAAATLAELDEELAERGTSLVLTRVKGPVREVLLKTGLLTKLGEEGRIFLSTHLAVEALRSGGPLRPTATRPEDPRSPADQIGCGRSLRVETKPKRKVADVE